MIREHSEMAAIVHDHGAHPVLVSLLDRHLHRLRSDVEAEAGVTVERGGGVTLPDHPHIWPRVDGACAVLLHVT